MQGIQQFRSRISKGAVLKAVLVLYILLSAAYILLTQFQAYQTRLVQEAFMEGQITAIEELINEAENGCQPIPVYIEDRQVELINVACLVPAGEGESPELSPVEPGGE